MYPNTQMGHKACTPVTQLVRLTATPPNPAAAATGLSSWAMDKCTSCTKPPVATVALVRSTLAAAHSNRLTRPEKTTRSQAVRDLRTSASPGGASGGIEADLHRRILPKRCRTERRRSLGSTMPTPAGHA
jgi:hypothetical protein